MMQTDVKSTHLNASGSVFAARARIKGFVMCATAGQAGTLLLRNGGASGTIVIEVDIPANSNPNSFYILVPGEGVLCSTNVYASITNLASVTVFYG
jgi:hypothetical protein